jgi:hypothetical protein
VPFVDSQALEVKEPLPGWKGRFFDSQSMPFGHYDVTAGAGFVAIVLPDTLHSVRALTDGRAIVVDHPLRAAIGGVKL